MRFLRVFIAAIFFFILTIAPAFADSALDGVQQNLMCQCGCTMVLSSCECGTAEQMRGEIKTMLGQGQSQQQMLDYYVGKYGEKVLSAPTKQGFNLTAYITPFAGIVVAGAGVFLLVRQWVVRSKRTAVALSDQTNETQTAAPLPQISADALRAQLTRELATYGE